MGESVEIDVVPVAFRHCNRCGAIEIMDILVHNPVSPLDAVADLDNAIVHETLNVRFGP